MNNYHTCLVCMGSNVDGCFHLQKAREALSHLFSQAEFGEPIETKAEGVTAQPNYWNQAVRFHTDSKADRVIEILKDIEKENNRTATDKITGRVPLDLDLLSYDEDILKPSDMHKSFVIQALSSLPVSKSQKLQK